MDCASTEFVQEFKFMILVSDGQSFLPVFVEANEAVIKKYTLFSLILFGFLDQFF